MWNLSGAARQALAQSHTMNARLDVLHNGERVYTLVPFGGSVSTVAGRSVMRNLTATVVDPTGRLGGGDIEDLLSPYDSEVAPYRAVQSGRTAAGAPIWEWVPQGVYGLTGRGVAGDGTVQLSGQDRAMIYQGGMSGQVAISIGTPVERAIQQLLSTRNLNLQMRSWVTGYTVGPLLFQPDINVWGEAQKLAESVGGWLWHDREGYLHFTPLAPTSPIITARYETGDGLLIDASRKEDSDSIHNVVVVQNPRQQGAETGETGPVIITATAEDNDPRSATYSRGRYGRRVKVITNQNITTQQQADQAAAAGLVVELGRSETVDMAAVVHPGLDVLDMVALHRPQIGVVERTLLVQQLDVPLVARDAMRVGFRRYILTRDGQTVDTTLAVNG